MGEPDLVELLEGESTDRRRSLDELRSLVEVDSGTYTPDGVNQVVARCRARLEEDGWRVSVSACDPGPGRAPVGDLLVARRSGRGGPRILLVGHTDTVFPEGTAAGRPLREDGGRLLGPGVCDMKGGLVLGFRAVRALIRQGFDGFEELTMLLNPDEEIGSPASRPFIETEARRHDVALVLEAARASGAVVSSRKGVTTATVEVHGRAAHAGVEPEKGRSALLAASRLAVELHTLNGRWPGTTVNVGTLRSGSRTNIVPEEGILELEIRSPVADDLRSAEQVVERVVSEAEADGIRATVEVRREHEPMERSEGTARLVEVAGSVASDLGFSLTEEATGGASDANTIAALGVPTLDGLGPIGGDDHSEREWIELDTVPLRTALLAGLIVRAHEAIEER